MITTHIANTLPDLTQFTIADIKHSISRSYITCDPSQQPNTIPIPITTTVLTPTFQQYITTLPQWELNLLENIHFELPIHTITNFFNQHNELITIVSDGGNIDQYGSFGWAIGTNHVTLIENHGNARGTPMNSYRAEAYGKLSWIIFLKHFITYHQLTPRCTFTSFLDNLEVVKHTTYTKNYKRASNALCADHDILAAISHEQRILLNTKITLLEGRHVKGHQDDNKVYHELPRAAQLNIRADQLATSALQKSMNNKTTFHTDINPHCNIYLQSNGEIITNKEQSVLRWKWSELRLQHYYTKRFNLTYNQLHDINWAGKNSAQQYLTPRQTNFSIKLTTRWLPVNKTTSKYGHIISGCHRCSQPETIHHLFTCEMDMENRLKYITTILRILSKYDTEQQISDTIIHGLRSYTNIPTAFQVPDHLQHCYSTQSKFGWNLFTSGLLIQQWSQHQQQHINTTDTEHKNLAGDIWNKHISKGLIQSAFQLWCNRCDEVHNNELSQDTQETTAQLHRFYKQAHSLTTDQQKAIFDTPIVDHIAKGTRHIKQWIRQNAITLRKLRNINQNATKSRQTTLTRFWGNTVRKKATPRNIDVQSELPVLE